MPIARCPAVHINELAAGVYNNLVVEGAAALSFVVVKLLPLRGAPDVDMNTINRTNNTRQSTKVLETMHRPACIVPRGELDEKGIKVLNHKMAKSM